MKSKPAKAKTVAKREPPKPVAKKPAAKAAPKLAPAKPAAAKATPAKTGKVAAIAKAAKPVAVKTAPKPPAKPKAPPKPPPISLKKKDLQHFRDLLDGLPTEVVKLDDQGGGLVDLGEVVQDFIDADDQVGVGGRGDAVVAEGQAAVIATALVVVTVMKAELPKMAPSGVPIMMA